MPTTFSHPELLTAATTGIGGNMGRAGLVPTTTATRPTFQTVLPGAEISGQFIVPSYSGATFALTLVSDIGQITSVLLNGQTYRYSLKATPTAGTYRYNPTTAVLTVAPLSGVAAGMTGLLRGLPGGGLRAGFAATIRTEWDEPLDPLLARWNISGDVDISRSFRAHPTCSFSFQSYENQRSTIRSEWKNGNTTWVIRGIRFRQTSIEISRNKGDVRGALTVNVNGVGYHEKLLSANIAYGIPSGSGVSQTSAATLCRLAGTAYRGPAIPVPVPADVKATDRTTAGEWVESRDRSVAGYAYYSSPDAVEVRPWASPKIHFLSDAELTDNLPDFSTSADGADFEDVQLSEEFKNRPWEPDREEGQDDEDSTLDQGNTVIGNTVILYSETDSSPSRPPRDVDVLDEGLAWPNGPTKVQKWTHLKNGEITKVVEQTWGFLFRAWQIYRTVQFNSSYISYPNPGAALSTWQVVKKTTMTRRVDSQGYLIEEPIIGWEYARFLDDDTVELRRKYTQATGDSNLQSFYLHKLYLCSYINPGPGLVLNVGSPFPPNKQANFKRPIRQTKRFFLDKLKNYYDDVQAESDGSDPKFVIKTVDEEDSRVTTPDPAGIYGETTNGEIPPDLVVGRFFKREESVHILSSRPGRERFEVKTTTENNEGPEFKKTARTTSTEEKEGRPGTAQRLNLKIKNPAFIPGDPSTDEVQGKSYLFNTPGSGVGPNDTRGDSISFDGVVSPEAAAKAAKVDAEIANSQGYPATFQYAPTRALQEGDVVVAVDTPYRVFGVDESFTILGPGSKPNTMRVQAASGFSANVGRAFDIDLTVYEVES